jgi:GNAT superfamily N-acetyltransferase
VNVSERVAAAMCGAWLDRTAALGGTVHRNDGIVTCLTGLDAAPFNPSLVEHTPRDPAAALAAAERIYDMVGLPFGIDLDPARDGTVRDRAADAGLRVIEERPAMLAQPSAVPDVPPPEGVVIERAEEHLTEVAEVASAGFGGDPMINRAFVADGVFQDHCARVYLAWLGGRPVATAETSLQEGALCVSGVATVPEARRRGIGRAITARAVRDRASEADMAFLQSSEMGHGVYESLGFRDVAMWEVWARAV